MQVKSINKELEEITSKVVGKWYSKDKDHSIDFSHTDRILNAATVTITRKGLPSHRSTYKIGISDPLTLSNVTNFYFEIDRPPHKERYLIKGITKNEMIVCQTKAYTKQSDDIIFVRK